METLIQASTSEGRPFESLSRYEMEELRARLDAELDPFKKQLAETTKLIQANRNFRFELDLEEAIRKSEAAK